MTSLFKRRTNKEFTGPKKPLPPVNRLGPDPRDPNASFHGPNYFKTLRIYTTSEKTSWETVDVVQLQGYSPDIDRIIRAALDNEPVRGSIYPLDLSELREHLFYGVWQVPESFRCPDQVAFTEKKALERMSLFFSICKEQPSKRKIFQVEDVIVVTSIAAYFNIFNDLTCDKSLGFRETIAKYLSPYRNGTNQVNLFGQIVKHPSCAVLLLRVAEVLRHETLFQEAGRHVVGTYEHIRDNPDAFKWFLELLDRNTIDAVELAYTQVKNYLRSTMWFQLRSLNFEDEFRMREMLDGSSPTRISRDSLMKARYFILRTLAESEDIRRMAGDKGGWLPKSWWIEVPGAEKRFSRRLHIHPRDHSPETYFRRQARVEMDGFNPPVSSSRHVLKAIYSNEELWHIIHASTPTAPTGKSSKRDKLKSLLRSVPIVGQQLQKMENKKAIENLKVSLSGKENKESQNGNKTGDSQANVTAHPLDSELDFLRDQVGVYLEPLVGDGTFQGTGPDYPNYPNTPLRGEKGSPIGRGPRNSKNPQRPASCSTERLKLMDSIRGDWGVEYLLCGNLMAPVGYHDSLNSKIYFGPNKSTSALQTNGQGRERVFSGKNKSVSQLTVYKPPQDVSSSSSSDRTSSGLSVADQLSANIADSMASGAFKTPEERALDDGRAESHQQSTQNTISDGGRFQEMGLHQEPGSDNIMASLPDQRNGVNSEQTSPVDEIQEQNTTGGPQINALNFKTLGLGL